MRHGREVDVLLRVVPEFLPMTKRKHLAAVERLPVLRGHDDFGNVIRIAVHRDAAFEDIERHAFGPLYRAGFNVTINTDNRLMSGITLSDEYAALATAFGLDMTDLGNITENALLAGFGDWPTRQRLIEEVVRPAYDVAI